MTSAEDLAARAAAGEPRAVARLISWVEDGAPDLAAALGALPAGGPAYVIGLTGSPGVGKSTV
ncbi:MAG: methylmalonyl Co-A mutase-associated GTPase MeaB, partial [Candidatus Nanopelagicales bacterium]